MEPRRGSADETATRDQVFTPLHNEETVAIIFYNAQLAEAQLAAATTVVPAKKAIHKSLFELRSRGGGVRGHPSEALKEPILRRSENLGN